MDASYIEFVLLCQKRALYQLSPFHPTPPPPPHHHHFAACLIFQFLLRITSQQLPRPGSLLDLSFLSLPPYLIHAPCPVDLSSSVFPKSTSGFPSHCFGLGLHPLRFSQPITLLHSLPLVHPFCTFFFSLTKCMYKHIPLLLLKLMAAYVPLR